MFLVGHAAVGIALASRTKNPIVAFGIGWLSHYLADFFPHGDEPLGAWAKRGNEIRRMFVAVAIDGIVFLSVFAGFTAAKGFSPVAAAAALGSFVPDIMWGLEKLFGRNLFGPFERLHNRNHNFFRIKFPLWLGLLYQAAVTTGLWWYLIAR